jgi:hypothetical protein
MAARRMIGGMLLAVALATSACLIYSQNPPSGPDCADAGVDACDEDGGPGLEGMSAKAHPLASCVFCADVGGRNDVKHLCPASAVAWDAMVACICGTCSGACGSDWCARLADVQYTNASASCDACYLPACAAELNACSAAQ